MARKPAGLDILNPLLKKPFFTALEAKKLGISTSVLHHYCKSGRLKRLSRGIYQSSEYKSPVGNFQWEDLIEAVHSIPGGVICLISALALYNITEEIPRRYWIAVSHKTSMKRVRAIKIVRLRDMKLGKTEITLEGVHLPIFDRERTIVDAFRLLSYETAIKALKMALSSQAKQRIDLRKLENYAHKLRVNIAPYLMAVTT